MSDETPVERSTIPTEFQLAVVQMLIKFGTAAGGDIERMASMARAQVVAGQAMRSLTTRSQLLGRRLDQWAHGDLLELVKTAERGDVAPGSESA